MIWLITLGGFLLGCLVAYAMIQGGKDEDSED